MIKILSKYTVNLHELNNVDIQIVQGEDIVTLYKVIKPEITKTTELLLSDVRDKLLKDSQIGIQELFEESSFKKMSDEFTKKADKLIANILPVTKPEDKNVLVCNLLCDMLGLGDLEVPLSDPSLEEVVVNTSKEPVWVYHKEFGWLKTNITIQTEKDIQNYSSIIARRIGRQITTLEPLLDAHLATGDRANATLFPVSTKGNTITIRKFARDPFTIIDLINSKTCDLNIASLLWLAIEYEMNILISGGTGSGKTSFLNACMPFIPPNQRIISIEDTRELMLPEFLYWTPLVTRTANPEGKGEVSMLDLLINSLRMRPDRIVLGEMRKQQEAMVLFEAMHTGHSVYATVHADTASETISRLINPPINVPPNLLKAVNLNVVMFRDRRKGIRRILQLAEFNAEKDEARANILYRWTADGDKIVRHGESIRFYEEIGRHTGMSQKEINLSLDQRNKILSWMIKNNIRDLNSFGKVTNLYYKNKDFLLKAINQNNIRAVLE